MTIAQLILTYIVVFSVCIFWVLPAGITLPSDPGPLEARGAPEKTHFKRKLRWSALIALVITSLLYVIISQDIIRLEP